MFRSSLSLRKGTQPQRVFDFYNWWTNPKCIKCSWDSHTLNRRRHLVSNQICKRQIAKNHAFDRNAYSLCNMKEKEQKQKVPETLPMESNTNLASTAEEDPTNNLQQPRAHATLSDLGFRTVAAREPTPQTPSARRRTRHPPRQHLPLGEYASHMCKPTSILSGA